MQPGSVGYFDAGALGGIASMYTDCTGGGGFFGASTTHLMKYAVKSTAMIPNTMARVLYSSIMVRGLYL